MVESNGPARILIVDDDKNNIVLITDILEMDGYNVHTAKNGLEALNVVKKENINLVISDIRMPKMDGMATLREIKKIKPDLDVILMTAFGEVESYLDAMDMGAFEYFNKPFDVKVFRDFVKKALGRRLNSPDKEST